MLTATTRKKQTPATNFSSADASNCLLLPTMCLLLSIMQHRQQSSGPNQVKSSPIQVLSTTFNQNKLAKRERERKQSGK